MKHGRMKEKILKRTALLSAGFFILAMSAIVVLSMNKTIEISNVAQDEVSLEETIGADGSPNAEAMKPEAEKNSVPDYSLIFDDEKDTEYLCIPIPEKTEPENISIENHYMDLELRVVLKGVDPQFFQTASLGGRRSEILSGEYLPTENGTVLKFKMGGLYEYKSILENNELYISFLGPREMYEKVVVIDPSHGGKDDGISVEGLKEKDISLSVAKALKVMLDNTDVKAYYTRMDDVNPTEASRVCLANATKADMYIRIEADQSENSADYGVRCLYNDEFFIPGFGNVELADIMETEVVTAVKGKALGLEASDDANYTLMYSIVPATTVKVGCISNKQEAILLGREDYIEKIATGIYNGIMKVYEEEE